MRILLYMLLMPALAHGELLLSEIMSNEPGSQTQLEWIEVYNPTDLPVELSEYEVTIGGDSARALYDTSLVPHSYAILARKLCDESGGSAFESRWGDSSGYWGDSPVELILAVELEMALTNESGRVVLSRQDGSFADSCAWSEPCPDGVSLERESVTLPSSAWHHSVDPLGSTPGRANSRPGQFDHGKSYVDVTPRIARRESENSFKIEFSLLDGAEELTIEILDDTGRRIKLLYQGKYLYLGPAGIPAEIYWDCRNARGNLVTPGIYIIHVSISGDDNFTKSIPVVVAP
jgi:hypothetical protein